MSQFKICLLGAPGVGKTSLVRRFVHSCFSENYHSTIGVKIDKSSVDGDTGPIDLLIWDVQGEERFRNVLRPYLRGMAGYCLVSDATRPETLDSVVSLQQEIDAMMPGLPFLLVHNKQDLLPGDTTELAQPLPDALCTLLTSARSGYNVETAFGELARALERDRILRSA